MKASNSPSCGGRFIQGVRKPCQYYPTPLREVQDPTQAIDIFLFDVLIHELMTGVQSQHNYPWYGDEPCVADGPTLEREHLGDITRKCWDRVYENVEALKSDLVQYLAVKCWEIDVRDNLQNVRLDQGKYGSTLKA